MTENMKKWLELVSCDSALQSRVAAMGEIHTSQSREKITELARQNGISLSPQDFEESREEPCSLSDEDLESVTGGTDALFKQYYSCGCMTTGFGNDGLL